ncbi:Histidinol-phosphate aminotransferase 2 [Legionella massiliensis]|uniref:Histidinol-phosphate aminotransferase n=1 Tax=Legionella massiliensis TaxID=1034943 RepID=A0A078KRP8_9GAMM|nr:histidinol-phosphate transaminase [Legionella massiliensis]CDZ77100.1 Histidinol-phosphate aminotransferase 2 [Legionella massiliensis]CEE12838.1 Histidinol-phosphate aminotransferase 2 [Legionella massiliensis]
MPCDYYQLPHPGIRSLHPYIPGKSIEELMREQNLPDVIKLASNENPLGCSPLVRKALANLSRFQIASYPSPANHPITAKLSKKLGICEDMLTLGNGTDLLFLFLLTTFALGTGKHMLTHDCAFISYRIQAQTLGIPISTIALKPNWQVDIDAMIEACTEETAIIFLANPNNPTGLFIESKDLERLIANIPSSTIFVLDEAYYEYAYPKGDKTSINLLNCYPNLVITRTFSKAYGLAGLRLGYLIANPQITDLLHRVQPPFVVSQTALTAANAALDDHDFIEQSLALNTKGMLQFKEGFATLDIGYLPSSGNFVTIDCQTDAQPIYQKLLSKGIIVRPLLQYGLGNHLRISIGNTQQNSRLFEQLAICLPDS